MTPPPPPLGRMDKGRGWTRGDEGVTTGDCLRQTENSANALLASPNTKSCSDWQKQKCWGAVGNSMGLEDLLAGCDVGKSNFLDNWAAAGSGLVVEKTGVWSCTL